MPDPIKPTAADREALEHIDDDLGFLMDNEREIVLQAFALHAQQAREQALEEAAVACEKQRKAFGSNEYAVNQPFSSFGERFACGKCAEEIRALKDQCPC